MKHTLTKIAQLTITLAFSLAITGCSQENTSSASTVTKPQSAANKPNAPTAEAATNNKNEEPKAVVTTKPLNLDRNLDALIDESNEALAEPESALPDMFDDDPTVKRVVTKGRILTNDTPGVTLDAIEGAEVVFEIKTK